MPENEREVTDGLTRACEVWSNWMKAIEECGGGERALTGCCEWPEAQKVIAQQMILVDDGGCMEFCPPFWLQNDLLTPFPELLESTGLHNYPESLIEGTAEWETDEDIPENGYYLLLAPSPWVAKDDNLASVTFLAPDSRFFPENFLQNQNNLLR
jgi:hypothetical protein